MPGFFRSLSAKAILLVGCLCLMTGAAVMGISILSMRQDALDQLAQAAADSRGRAADVIDKTRQRADSYAKILASHPDVIAAIQSADASRLQNVVVGIYGSLHASDAVIASMEVTNAAGVVLMRGHNPSVNGDNKSHEKMVAAALSNQPASGLTVSPTSGQVAADAVRPIVVDGKVIGTLKVGSYFRLETAREMRRLSGAETAFLFKGKVNAATLEGLQIPDMPALAAAADGPAITIAHGNTSYETAVKKLALESADPVYLVSMIDRAPVFASLSALVFALSWKCLLALAVLLPIVAILVGRSSRAIRDVTWRFAAKTMR